MSSQDNERWRRAVEHMRKVREEADREDAPILAETYLAFETEEDRAAILRDRQTELTERDRLKQRWWRAWLPWLRAFLAPRWLRTVVATAAIVATTAVVFLVRTGSGVSVFVPVVHAEGLRAPEDLERIRKERGSWPEIPLFVAFCDYEDIGVRQYGLYESIAPSGDLADARLVPFGPTSKLPCQRPSLYPVTDAPSHDRFFAARPIVSAPGELDVEDPDAVLRPLDNFILYALHEGRGGYVGYGQAVLLDEPEEGVARLYWHSADWPMVLKAGEPPAVLLRAQNFEQAADLAAVRYPGGEDLNAVRARIADGMERVVLSASSYARAQGVMGMSTETRSRYAEAIAQLRSSERKGDAHGQAPPFGGDEPDEARPQAHEEMPQPESVTGHETMRPFLFAIHPGRNMSVDDLITKQTAGAWNGDLFCAVEAQQHGLPDALCFPDLRMCEAYRGPDAPMTAKVRSCAQVEGVPAEPRALEVDCGDRADPTPDLAGVLRTLCVVRNTSTSWLLAIMQGEGNLSSVRLQYPLHAALWQRKMVPVPIVVPGESKLVVMVDVDTTRPPWSGAALQFRVVGHRSSRVWVEDLDWVNASADCRSDQDCVPPLRCHVVRGRGRVCLPECREDRDCCSVDDNPAAAAGLSPCERACRGARCVER